MRPLGRHPEYRYRTNTNVCLLAVFFFLPFLPSLLNLFVSLYTFLSCMSVHFFQTFIFFSNLLSVFVWLVLFCFRDRIFLCSPGYELMTRSQVCLEVKCVCYWPPSPRNSRWCQKASGLQMQGKKGSEILEGKTLSAVLFQFLLIGSRTKGLNLNLAPSKLMG